MTKLFICYLVCFGFALRIIASDPGIAFPPMPSDGVEVQLLGATLAYLGNTKEIQAQYDALAASYIYRVGWPTFSDKNECACY